MYTVVEADAVVRNTHGRTEVVGTHGKALLQYAQSVKADASGPVHFGIPKVIFRRTNPHGSLSDPGGDLGMTCYCIGIEALPHQHAALQEWIRRYRSVLESLALSGKDVSYKMLGALKREFWTADSADPRSCCHGSGEGARNNPAGACGARAHVAPCQLTRPTGR